MIKKLPAFVFILFVATQTVANAAFVEPQSWSRGAGGTTYQQWDVMTSVNGPNTPDVADANPNGTATLTGSLDNTGAMVTSGGNIYAFGGTNSFTVIIPEADVPTPAHDVTAIVQISGLGTEIDYSSVYMNGLAPVETVELDRVSLGGFGGDQVDTWMLFNIPYASFGDGVAGVEDLTLEFAAAGAHLSLDQVSVDTAIRPFGFYAEPTPVPEPSTMVLAGLLSVAGLAFGGRLSRRQ